MKNIPVKDTRNFVMMGHNGSGKTSLADALAHKLGLNDRLGLVDNGSSLSDHTEEEKARKMSLFAQPMAGEYKTRSGRSIGFVFIDTPGFLDFYGQVIAGCRAADLGLICVDASSGVQVGTHRAWRSCQARGLTARAFMITGLDKDNTDFDKTLNSLQETFGSNCVPVTLPAADGSIVDVLGKNIPADLAGKVEEIKGSLVELAAETDDTLIEKFLAGEDLSPEEISEGLVSAVAGGGLIPVFACVPVKETGVDEFLDGAARLFPSPEAHEHKDQDGNVIGHTPEDPFVGLVWRSVNDAFVGQLNFIRVLGGTLKADAEVYNATRGQKEKVGTLLLVNGKKQEPIAEATAGDIVAIPKLKNTHVNDTLCAPGADIQCDKIKFPHPVFFQAVFAKTQADEDKIGTALSRVCEEDPTLHVVRNTETKEVVLQGMGDTHIDVAVELMKHRSNVQVTLAVPKVPYRETVTALGEGHYKHKKQSGGRGQYGEVYLRVEPKPPEEEEWFVDAIVGGVIPGNFMPAVQKGLVEGMQFGAVAGYPVDNIKVTVYDGSYHDVDSSEIAFKIAGSRALRLGMGNAKPVLLEPVMKVKIFVPEQYMGDINGDLNHKRGRILGMGAENGLQVIEADIPQAELFRYAAELRSMTQGQGTFEMEFARYDVVPANVAQKIIAEAEKHKEDE